MSTKLPAPLTRFVGRETELAQAAALLAEARLLTLTGPGGAGKTRLALRLAAAAAEGFPDGTWFVDFSPLSGGDFVWDQVATTLGINEPGSGRTLAQAVRAYLSGRQALVVLDNCEHVVDSAAEATAGLLEAAPALKVVATSREPLEVGGEVTWAVPPLSDVDALELFTDRARRARPQFSLRDEDADAVRSICRRLDGLPLAIELAAARTRALASAHIAAALSDRLELLPTGPRTAPHRQSTLRASFDWSYDLLSDAERALLRQCSVFTGGFDLEDALAVCPAAGLDVLAALVDRSLLFVDDADAAAPRYRMLETIREFAAERLAKAGEVDLIGTRHRDHYLWLAETAEPKLVGPDQNRWRARLFAEQDNVRAALAWSREQGEAETLARMVAALSMFWLNAGGLQLSRRLTDLQIWVEAAAERHADVPPRLRARIRNFQCVLASGVLAPVSRGAHAEVPALANEALALARASGDKHEEAFALCNLSIVAGLTGGSEAMRPYLEEALPLARSTGFSMGVLGLLGFFVLLRLFQSDPWETRRLAEEAIDAAKADAFHNQLATMAFGGIVALTQGRLTDAAQLFEATLAGGRETNDSNYLHSLLGLAWIGMFRGDFTGARSAVDESLAAMRKSGAQVVSVTAIVPLSQLILGSMHLACGDAAQARDALAPLAGAVRGSMVSRWASLPLTLLAEAQLALGALGEATASLEEASSLALAGKLTWILGRVGLVRAKLQMHEVNLQEAESMVHEALNLGREAGDRMGLVDGLELLARLVEQQDSHKEAVRLWAAADAQRTRLGYARFPVEQGPYSAGIATAQAALGSDEFAAAWGEGAKVSIDDAIAYAVRGRGERKRPSMGWASLTPTELEVVRLVGGHLTNPEIAKRLFVSRATVKTHLVHIFSKLGTESRSELAGEAVRRGIALQPSRRS